jgi:hypothetical protein
MDWLAAIGLLLALAAPADATAAEGELRLGPEALAAFRAERQRVPLLRVFDRNQRPVLEVRGWGEALRPLEGLAGRGPVAGRPDLAARLAELEGPVPALDPTADFTVLLYRAHWCLICKRMEPQLLAQMRAAASLRFALVRIEADTSANDGRSPVRAPSRAEGDAQAAAVRPASMAADDFSKERRQ